MNSSDKYGSNDSDLHKLDRELSLLQEDISSFDNEIISKTSKSNAENFARNAEERLKAEEARDLDEEIDEEIEELEKVRDLSDLFEHLKSMKNFIENHDLRLNSLDGDLSDLKLIKEELDSIKSVLNTKNPPAKNFLELNNRVQNLEVEIRLIDRALNSLISDLELEIKKNMEDVFKFVSNSNKRIESLEKKLEILLDNKFDLKKSKNDVKKLDLEFHNIAKDLHKKEISSVLTKDYLEARYKQLLDLFSEIKKNTSDQRILKHCYTVLKNWNEKMRVFLR